jgi:AcrR family transcriptional regulator
MYLFKEGKQMKNSDTKTKILDVAEKLFAEIGIHATSIRQIVKEAGVNVASLHYHFGSKEAVIHQIITRRLQPINELKVKRLDQLENNSKGKNPELVDILRAFIEPHIQMQRMDADKVKILMKLMVQIEDDAHRLEVMQDPVLINTFKRFISALQSVLPQLSLSELTWRFKFMIFSMHAIMVRHPIPSDSGFYDNKENIDEVLNHVITFLKAGFLAPPSSNSNDI